MTVLGNSKIPQSRRGIFIEIASVALLPRNDGDFRNDGILNGILNEILGSSLRMTQGFKDKKRYPAGAKQKKLS